MCAEETYATVLGLVAIAICLAPILWTVWILPAEDDDEVIR